MTRERISKAVAIAMGGRPGRSETGSSSRVIGGLRTSSHSPALSQSLKFLIYADGGRPLPREYYRYDAGSDSGAEKCFGGGRQCCITDGAEDDRAWQSRSFSQLKISRLAKGVNQDGL